MVDLGAYNDSLAELVNRCSDSDTIHVVISESELNELPLSAYSCEICGLRVKSKANLRAHKIKTHRIMKSVKDFAFYSKQKYPLNHVYHCPFNPCKHNIGHDGGFSTYSRLKQHYQHVHMRKKYECIKCKQSFSTPAYHAYHERQCGLTHFCSVCHRVYSNKKHLLQHYRRSGHKACSSSEVENPQKIMSMEETSQATHSDNSAPIVLPIFVLPVNLSSGTSHLNPSVTNNRSCEGIISALQSISGQVLSEQLLKHSFQSNTQYGDTLFTYSLPVNIKPSTQLPNNVEASTQTDGQYLPQLNLQPTSQISQPEYVSVNTCTDEDNISTFLGGLFCDANVGTNCSTDEVAVSEICGYASDAIENINNRHYSPMQLNSHNVSVIENMNNCDPINSNVNGSMTNSLGLRIIRSLDSDACMPSHSLVKSVDNTDNNDNHRNGRMLETPPPLYIPSINNVLLGTHLNTACQTFRSPVGKSQSTCTHISASTNIPLNEGGFPGEFQKSEPMSLSTFTDSSNSIETQAENWSSSVFTTNETQTIDHDIELWLNSVETQTTTTQFDPGLFSDICVGVDDDFLV